MYDIIIVGGGPAGMTAGIYAARNGKSALVIEKESFGGQMIFSPKIENYPGIASASGSQIAESMLDQMLSLGVEIDTDIVTSIAKDGKGNFLIKTAMRGEENPYTAHAVILATGVKHRLMGLENEELFIGNGISFCAVCDGDFYTDKEVIVVGGGNSALQEALLLSEKCSDITILQDLPELTGEKMLQEAIAKKSNIGVATNIKIESLRIEDIGGVPTLHGLNVMNTAQGDRFSIVADGIFVAIGLIPENKPFENVAELNSSGYFDAGERCATVTNGIFVAGDCRRKNIRQITTAVSDGAIAALAACRYIDQHV